MVSFNSIPSDIRTPGTYVEFDNSRAVRGLALQPKKALIIGQKLASGTMAAATPTLISGTAVGEVAAGRGSILARMIAAFKNANTDTELWAVALADNGAGAAATSTITLSGTATASGTLYLYVDGVQVQVGVTSGDAAAAVATAAAAEINLHTELPVTAGAAGAVVTLTARNKGTVGNQTTVSTNYNQGELLPAGIGAAVVAPSGGATDPVLATALAAMGDVQYHTIITHMTDATSLTALEAELLTRFGPMVALDGQAFVGINDTLASTATFGQTRNSPSLTIMGGGLSPTPAYIWATVTGAADAAEPDPARLRQYLVLKGVLPPPPELRFTRAERNTLLHDGVSTYVVDNAGVVSIERLITTYQENAQGFPDTSYLDIEPLHILSYLRFSRRARIASRYPRAKLADDGTAFGPGQAVLTPSIQRADLISQCRDWEAAGLVEGVDKWKDRIVVVRSETDPSRTEEIVPVNLINGLRVLASQFQFSL